MMFRLIYYLVLALIISSKCSECARILGAVFTPSYSHQVTFWPIWKELSLRGHQLTILTTNPNNDSTLTNITEIDLSVSYPIINNVTSFLSKNEKQISKFQLLDIYCSALSEVADKQLQHPEVKELISGKPKFDLLMVEVIYPTYMAFAEHLNIPFIGLTSLDAPPRIHEAIGNPVHPALYPDFALPFVPPLKFKERIISTFMYFYMKWYSYYKLYPREDKNIKKHFGNHLHPLSEIERNMSMLFLNANPIFNGVRPVGPNTILIGGGTHFTKTKPLPKDIKELLDNSTAGLIYLSFGTNVKSKDLKDETKQILLDTFRNLPYNVLWKFENKDIFNVPPNVKIMQWVPQQDLFRHPNVKLFITQCGLQSMEEAIFNHIPMIGIPFFGDQLNNAKILETRGFGIRLSYDQLDKQVLKKAIIEVIDNPKYRIKVKELAELYQDSESSGVEKAVWWTEYVLRHKGAIHLRSPAVDMPVYQYFLVDVIGLVALVTFILLFIVYKILRCLISFCCAKKHKTD